MDKQHSEPLLESF